MIFVGFNDLMPTGQKGLSELINGAYWDAFGDLLDEVLLPNYPELHESIKSEEGSYLNFYSFQELDAAQFNLAVKLIRQHLLTMQPSDWPPREYVTDMALFQERARTVWENTLEKLVVLDRRYAAAQASVVS